MTENPTQTPPPAGPPPAGPDPRYARPHDGGSALDDAFARLRESGYGRDTDARWFGGVCSGLGRRWNVDPVLVRAIAVVLAFFGGIGITAYVVLWLVLPDQRGDILAERAIRRGDLGPVALLVVTALLLLGGFFSIGQGNGWVAPLWVVALAGLAFVLIRRDRVSGPSPTHVPAPAGSTPPPPPPGGAPMNAPTTAFSPPAGAAAPGASASPGYAMPPGQQAPYGAAPQPGPYGGQQPWGGQPWGGHPAPPAPPRPVAPLPPPRPRRRRPSWFVGLVSLGIALVGLGLGVALAEPLGYPGSAGTLGLLIGLTGVSLAVLTLGISGRAAGFSGFLTVLLAFLLVGSAAASRVDLEESSGFGPRTWTPVPAAGETRFEHGGGDVVLDLARFAGAEADPARRQVISVEVGAGDLRILVPEGVSAQIGASVGFGSIMQRSADGSTAPDSTGPDRSVTTTVGDGPTAVTIDAQLGVGEITIEEQ
ncbi:PspC domain-containing protein [Oryzobacter terrae]|uniref:PspC domain-containing protein n=1 Tax=Oryzobacter terrae TaxID=1620385 RepID=UPI003670C876